MWLEELSGHVIFLLILGIVQRDAVSGNSCGGSR
jgi:hypothetical protein